MILCTSVVFFVGLCIHTCVMVLYVCVCVHVCGVGGACKMKWRRLVLQPVDPLPAMTPVQVCHTIVHAWSIWGPHQVPDMMTPQPNTGCIKPFTTWVYTVTPATCKRLVDAEGRLYYSQHKCPVATAEQTANSQEVSQGAHQAYRCCCHSPRQQREYPALPCRYIHTRENLHLGATALSSKGLAAL